MATKTDGDSPSAIYHRQRSNSDPQPAVEVLSTNTLNADKGKYNTLKEKAGKRFLYFILSQRPYCYSATRPTATAIPLIIL